MSVGVLPVTKETFETEVMREKVPVLLDFWAPWCAPCQQLHPILEKLAGEVGETAKIVRVNVDEQPELAEAFGVLSIPTLLVIRNGRLTARETGVLSKGKLKKLLDR